MEIFLAFGGPISWCFRHLGPILSELKAIVTFLLTNENSTILLGEANSSD